MYELWPFCADAVSPCTSSTVHAEVRYLIMSQFCSAEDARKKEPDELLHKPVFPLLREDQSKPKLAHLLLTDILA